jgi:hypothetical protein
MAEIKNPGVKPVAPVVAVDIEKVRYCEDGGTTKVEFIRCFRYEDGVLVGFTDYEVDGSTPYTVIDPANVSECAIPEAADVEQRVLCDKQATGESTTFIRHTVYNSDGTVGSQYDTTLDSTVAYTVVGEVKECNEVIKTKALYNNTLAVTDAAISSIDTSVIDSTYGNLVCAKVQVHGGPVFFTVNPGGVPDGDINGDFAGFRVDDCGTFTLGCCPGSVGNVDEISDFQVIAGPGESAILTITYYAEDV